MSSEVRARPWPASERGFAWRAGRPLWKLLAAPVPASFVPTPDPLGAWHNPPASPRLSFASSCGCPLLACEPMPPEPAFCDGFPPPSPPVGPASAVSQASADLHSRRHRRPRPSERLPTCQVVFSATAPLWPGWPPPPVGSSPSPAASSPLPWAGPPGPGRPEGIGGA